MSETIQLAPASGSGIGKQLADMLLSRPGFVELMADAAEGGLRAMTPRRWDKETETWICDADSRVRIQTLALLLAHMEGEPIKRIIHQHLGGTGEVDPLAALRESPALREAAGALLEKANFRDRHRKTKQVKAEDAAEGPASAF